MDEPIIGQIQLFAFGFTQIGWIPCDGRLLDIRQYNALFSLIGNTYGGNGITNFAVPNLIDASPINVPQTVMGRYFIAVLGTYPTRE